MGETMMVGTRFLWRGILTAVPVCVLAPGACADGCFVWHGGADLAEPSRKPIIHLDRGTETLLPVSHDLRFLRRPTRTRWKIGPDALDPAGRRMSLRIRDLETEHIEARG